MRWSCWFCFFISDIVLQCCLVKRRHQVYKWHGVRILIFVILKIECKFTETTIYWANVTDQHYRVLWRRPTLVNVYNSLFVLCVDHDLTRLNHCAFHVGFICKSLDLEGFKNVQHNIEQQVYYSLIKQHNWMRHCEMFMYINN